MTMQILKPTTKAIDIDVRVRIARLRLAQRCLINAAEADPELHTDVQWTRSLANVTALLVRCGRADHPRKEAHATA